MKDFWECKTVEECSEYMAHQALAEAGRLRKLLNAQPTIRRETRFAAENAIAEHVRYAAQVIGLFEEGKRK